MPVSRSKGPQSNEPPCREQLNGDCLPLVSRNVGKGARQECAGEGQQRAGVSRSTRSVSPVLPSGGAHCSARLSRVVGPLAPKAGPSFREPPCVKDGDYGWAGWQNWSPTPPLRPHGLAWENKRVLICPTPGHASQPAEQRAEQQRRDPTPAGQVAHSPPGRARRDA